MCVWSCFLLRSLKLKAHCTPPKDFNKNSKAEHKRLFHIELFASIQDIWDQRLLLSCPNRYCKEEKEEQNETLKSLPLRRSDREEDECEEQEEDERLMIFVQKKKERLMIISLSFGGDSGFHFGRSN